MGVTTLPPLMTWDHPGPKFFCSAEGPAWAASNEAEWLVALLRRVGVRLASCGPRLLPLNTAPVVGCVVYPTAAAF